MSTTSAEILQVTKDNALQAYKEAGSEGKGLLANLFGKRHFLTKVTERITSFEEACLEVGEDPMASKFSEGTRDEIAFKKLKVIVRALNEGWTPNWNNGSEYKWYPWFFLDSPGFRLDVVVYVRTGTPAGLGSRLCFKSRELSDYAAKTFLCLYEALIA